MLPNPFHLKSFLQSHTEMDPNKVRCFLDLVSFACPVRHIYIGVVSPLAGVDHDKLSKVIALKIHHFLEGTCRFQSN